MKYEWRKKEKEYYLPKSKPEVVDIKEFKFIQLSGEGNPNSEGFSEAIGVLYLLAYAIKMMPRNGIDIDGYYDYVVYPLEGLWDLKEEARGKEVLDKDKLVYTLMIRQPDFVTEEVFNKAMEIVKKKKRIILIAGPSSSGKTTFAQRLCIQLRVNGMRPLYMGTDDYFVER